MTERPTDLSSLPSQGAPRRSLFSARKFALMASVVAGLGVVGYGLSPQQAPAGLFTTPAHAQVNNEVRKVEKPVGFADIVERVKPSVISVKVNIGDKVAKEDSANKDEDFAVPAGLADGALLPSLWRTGWYASGSARWTARRRAWDDRPGFGLLHFG